MKVEERENGAIAFVCKDKEEFEILSNNYQTLKNEFDRMINEAVKK